jgi:hypothetical protein
MMSLTREFTTPPKAVPMMTPIARAGALVSVRKPLNSPSMPFDTSMVMD